MAQIKKDTSLRKAILQAAITGQLISDVKGTTETGKELLDRIIEERNKKLLEEWEEALKKNPKAKKPAPVVASEIDEDEIPFEIPENWCWCKLEDICEFENGDRSSKYPVESDYVTDGIPFFGAKDIEKNKLSFSNIRFISQAKFDSLGNGKLQNLDFICLLRGTVGKTAQFIESEKYKTGFICAQMLIIRSLSNPSFISFLMETPYIVEEIESKVTGTAVRQLPALEVKNLLIPFSPLAVQNAIVEKLEQVLPLVDAYENAVLQKEELKNALPDKVKKAILQEAITGKLTETWRKTANITENGKQLLDRIITERNEKALAEWEEALKKNPKAKKPVAVVASEIEENEIPFEVPESWCWCRLGEVCTKLVDGDHNPPADLPTKTEYIMASSQNINNDSLVDLEKVRYLSKEVFEVENERTKAEKGDIFFTSVGTLGRSCVYDGTKNICFQRSVSVLKTEIYNKFLKYCLDTPFIQFFIIDNATGTAQKGFYLNQLAKLVIPLPPLEEQEEIVKKVEELLPLCK